MGIPAVVVKLDVGLLFVGVVGSGKVYLVWFGEVY